MRIRFVENISNDPRIEIMPDSGVFDSMDAVITVSFFKYVDSEKVYEPAVRANVSFGNKMNPEEALQWAKCFDAAYNISSLMMPENLWNHSDSINKCWHRVGEVANKFFIILD